MARPVHPCLLLAGSPARAGTLALFGLLVWARHETDVGDWFAGGTGARWRASRAAKPARERGVGIGAGVAPARTRDTAWGTRRPLPARGVARWRAVGRSGWREAPAAPLVEREPSRRRTGLHESPRPQCYPRRRTSRCTQNFSGYALSIYLRGTRSLRPGARRAECRAPLRSK